MRNQTTVLRAFHNDPKVKEKYLARVRAHREADEIIHGTYWSRGKGCAIGCTIHSSEHSQYETELGIPKWLAYLEDVIFEGLGNSQAQLFPEKFLKAIPIGAVIGDDVQHKFFIWLLTDKIHGVILYANKDMRVIDVIEAVALLHMRALSGRVGEESAARSAAWSAARPV